MPRSQEYRDRGRDRSSERFGAVLSSRGAAKVRDCIGIDDWRVAATVTASVSAGAKNDESSDKKWNFAENRFPTRNDRLNNNRRL